MKSRRRKGLSGSEIELIYKRSETERIIIYWKKSMCLAYSCGLIGSEKQSRNRVEGFALFLVSGRLRVRTGAEFGMTYAGSIYQRSTLTLLS